MANDIINLPNSFIRWCETTEEASCNDYSAAILPIYSQSDLQFMLRIDLTTTDYLDGRRFWLIKGDYDEGDVVDVGDRVFQLSHQYTPLDDINQDYLVVIADEACTTTGITATEGECLRLVMMDGSTGGIICTALQRFRFTSDTCFTNLVRYACADNTFGFYYEEASTLLGAQFYNQIRLPITLHSPLPITEKSGFRDSSGRFRTLSATKAKQWEVETDYLSNYQHQCLDCAIDHDELYITEDAIAGCDYSDAEYYRKEDDKYDIEWQDQPGHHLGVAKGKFKLMTNPYYAANNNC